MNLKKVGIVGFAAILLVASSCVPLRKYQDLETKKNNCNDENTALKKQNESLTTLTNEQSAVIEQMKKDNFYLQADTTRLGTVLRDMDRTYAKLNETNQLLIEKNKELLAGNRSETQKILADLQKTREILLRREDSLKALQTEYALKMKNVEELTKQLEASKLAIAEREKQLQELQSAINRKDSIVNALRNKVADALLGFEGKGLTIEQKQGRVYVKMDNKLLFASGSFEISAQGKDALVKLAKVLEQNKDIEVLIEGHTDNVPYKVNGNLEDNWDLSVKRATTITRIITANSTVDPKRLMAAGRSQFHPVDQADSPKARAKNRRTEIILSPDLDELFKIIEK